MVDSVTVSGLRAWARGAYAEEAGVELLVRAFGGRFAQQGCPWIRPCERAGWFWVDTEAITSSSDGLSGGERRVLAVVASLIGSDPLESFDWLLAGLDRDNLTLVLAALSHAGGSHQHTDLIQTGDGVSFTRLPALVEWPKTARAA